MAIYTHRVRIYFLSLIYSMLKYMMSSRWRSLRVRGDCSRLAPDEVESAPAAAPVAVPEKKDYLIAYVRLESDMIGGKAGPRLGSGQVYGKGKIHATKEITLPGRTRLQ